MAYLLLYNSLVDTNDMEVPIEVNVMAKGLVDEYGPSFKYLG